MRRVAAILIACAFATSGASAQEVIRSYDTKINILDNASLDVTENITVRAEGNQIRRGIYRDFPTIYKDRFDNQVRVRLEVLSVERNGVIEPWFTERRANGTRINTGNDDFLPVPADYTYTIHYRTTRQLGFFPDHDELYWNAIGTGFVFPIEKGTVEIRLPDPVPIDQLHAEAYTGAQGVKGTDYTATLPAPGVARYALTAPLAPREGFTVVLTFPKGVIAPPTSEERTRSFFEDNRGVLIAVIGLMVALAYMWRAWSQVGRDPKKGIVITRYEPRDGQSPAGLRYMKRMGYDMRCFSSDVLALAVAGFVSIHREKKFLKDEWRLERAMPAGGTSISSGQQALLSRLFASGDTLILKDTNAATLSAAKDSHSESLKTEYQPEYFRLNIGKIVTATLLSIALMAAAFFASGGYGMPIIFAIIILLALTLVLFAWLVKAPTPAGRGLLDETEGLESYMRVAERDELKSIRGPDEPPLDAKRYEEMLPFAVALDVEDAWTKKFTAAVGAAAAAAAANNMMWYHGRGPVSNLGDFTKSVGSSLSSSISSASSPPGSGSGAGGGGFSGGGGGGGGGGGR